MTEPHGHECTAQASGLGASGVIPGHASTSELRPETDKDVPGRSGIASGRAAELVASVKGRSRRRCRVRVGGSGAQNSRVLRAQGFYGSV